MGNIYRKTITASPGTEQSWVMAPRESFIIPLTALPQWSTWAELRVGVFMSHVSVANGDNSPIVVETVPANAPGNYWSFGLKTNNDIIPGVAGTDFLGFMVNSGNNLNINLGGNSYSANVTSSVVRGATIANQSSIGGAGVQASGVGSNNLTQFCGYWGIKFKIANRGLSTQTIEIEWIGTTSSGLLYDNPTLPICETFLSGFTPSGGTNGTPVAWHDAGVPRAIPDALFIRVPFSQNRLRVHSYKVLPFA